MFRTLSLTTCLAVAGLLAPGTHVDAQTGPVREGMRRTGGAIADGTRGIVRGSRDTIRRSGQATRNTYGTTTDAARAQVDRAERSEFQANAGAANDVQANVNADLDANQQQLNADGQIQGALNDPNSDGRFESGYRGVEDQNMSADQNPNAQGDAHQQAGQMDYNGQMYNVRQDRSGRDFICVAGCPVYLDSQANNQQSHESYKLGDEQQQMQQQQMQQNDARYGNQQQSDVRHGNQQHQGSLQSRQENTYRPRNANGSVPAPPVPVRTDIDGAVPENPSLNADTDINAEQSTQLDDSADIDAAANVDSDVDANNDSDTNSSAEIDADADADVNAENEDSSADESESNSEN